MNWDLRNLMWICLVISVGECGGRLSKENLEKARCGVFRSGGPLAGKNHDAVISNLMGLPLDSEKPDGWVEYALGRRSELPVQTKHEGKDFNPALLLQLITADLEKTFPVPSSGAKKSGLEVQKHFSENAKPFLDRSVDLWRRSLVREVLVSCRAHASSAPIWDPLAEPLFQISLGTMTQIKTRLFERYVQWVEASTDRPTQSVLPKSDQNDPMKTAFDQILSKFASGHQKTEQEITQTYSDIFYFFAKIRYCYKTEADYLLAAAESSSDHPILSLAGKLEEVTAKQLKLASYPNHHGLAVDQNKIGADLIESYQVFYKASVDQKPSPNKFDLTIDTAGTLFAAVARGVHKQLGQTKSLPFLAHLIRARLPSLELKAEGLLSKYSIQAGFNIQKPTPDPKEILKAWINIYHHEVVTWATDAPDRFKHFWSSSPYWNSVLSLPQKTIEMIQIIDDKIELGFFPSAQDDFEIPIYDSVISLLGSNHFQDFSEFCQKMNLLVHNSLNKHKNYVLYKIFLANVADQSIPKFAFGSVQEQQIQSFLEAAAKEDGLNFKLAVEAAAKKLQLQPGLDLRDMLMAVIEKANDSSHLMVKAWRKAVRKRRTVRI